MVVVGHPGDEDNMGDDRGDDGPTDPVAPGTFLPLNEKIELFFQPSFVRSDVGDFFQVSIIVYTAAMSAISEPPQPPPPLPPQQQSFDFAKPFTFVFNDPNWLAKILIGGLFYLAVIVLIGPIFILGYNARLMRNVIAGNPQPLPEWSDLGEYFSEGLRLLGVVLLYSIPVIVLVCMFVIPAVIAGAVSHNNNDALNQLSGGFAGCASCLIFPLSILIALWMPAALTMAVVDRRFSAAFEFGRIWTYIRTNLANFLLAFVVYYVARFAAGFGVILLCIGVFFTAFWGMVVATYAYAEVYRLSTTR